MCLMPTHIETTNGKTKLYIEISRFVEQSDVFKDYMFSSLDLTVGITLVKYDTVFRTYFVNLV